MGGEDGPQVIFPRILVDIQVLSSNNVRKNAEEGSASFYVRQDGRGLDRQKAWG
jgi:hypothetical protein